MQTSAAQRLAKTLERQKQGRGNGWRWTALAAVGLAGALMARMMIVTDPLAAGVVATTVPRKDSPRTQYAYASLVNTKEAWLGVLEYYPPDGTGERQRYYAQRAKTQLARWYLEHGDVTNAEQLFQQLAELDATEREFRAIGISGLALCYEATNNLEKAADFLTDAIPLMDELDETTKQRLARLERRLKNAAKP